MIIWKSRDQVLECFEAYCSLIIQYDQDRPLQTFETQSVASNAKIPFHWENEDYNKVNYLDAFQESTAVDLNTKNGKKAFLSNQEEDLDSLKVLIPVLINFWIESSEIVFGKPDITVSQQLSICAAVIRIINLIWYPSVKMVCCLKMMVGNQRRSSKMEQIDYRTHIQPFPIWEI